MVKYFITSGNSQTGRATIVALKALGEHDIVAGARHPAKSEADLKSAGASEVVEFDFTKPDTVEKALKGVERVLIVHGPTDFANFSGWTQVVVDAAKKSGSVKVVGKIAGYASGSNIPHAVPQAHAKAFDVLKNSGFQFFTVGPCFFFENWFQHKGSIHSGHVYGAAGDAKVMYIAVNDIGAAAAQALKNIEKYNGKHLPIVGQNISEAEVLNEINEATGFHAKYISLSTKDYQDTLTKFGLPESQAEIIASFETIKASGLTGDVSELKEIIGREPINAKAWAHANAAIFKGQQH